MLREVRFENKTYKLILTKHAIERMSERSITKAEVVEIIEYGKSKKKDRKNKWWIYKKMKNRDDNSICLSISIESPNLIVVTTLIHWSPEL